MHRMSSFSGDRWNKGCVTRGVRNPREPISFLNCELHKKACEGLKATIS